MHHFKRMLPLMILCALAFISCKTVDYQGELVIIEHQVSDIHLKLTLLDRDTLIDRYGKEANPFIDFPEKLPRRYFFVFDTEINSEVSTVNFAKKTITIKVGSDEYKTSNPFTLQKAWEPYNDNDSQELHRGRTINKTLKPVEFTVAPDSPYEGLLVFLVPVKEAKEATLFLPASTPDGDEGVIEIPFTLKKMVDGEEEIPSENTGIFAE